VRPGAPSEGCTCRDRSGRTATRGCCAACGVHTAGRARPCARFYAKGHAGVYAGAPWVGKVRLSVRPSVGAAGKDGGWRPVPASWFPMGSRLRSPLLPLLPVGGASLSSPVFDSSWCGHSDRRSLGSRLSLRPSVRERWGQV